MADLRAIDACRRPRPLTGLPRGVLEITSPLNPAAWSVYLRLHPDQAFSSYLLDGLQHGFRIGFDYTTSCVPCWSNMKSARDNPLVVSSYLQEELRLGRVAVFPLDLGSHLVQLSPFGVIPKRGQPGKWRLILDLSSPSGRSVNDGISSSLTSFHYTSIDDAVKYIQQLGHGTLMAKLDLKAAYRNVPVHPQDRLLLGTCWDNSVYVDKALPFGLRSAPKIFSAVADAVLWAIHLRGVPRILHYLDDFLLFARPGSDAGCRFLDIAISTCLELGFIAHKIAGPTSCITFLGIELDSVHSQLRLPQEKLDSLKKELRSWHHKRHCTKRELLSLIGVLSHAAKVIKPGRTFLRRLIDLSTSVSELHHRIQLRHSARADIAWWRLFGLKWNGVSFLTPPAPSLSFSSDASGSWGCGAFSSPQWFSLHWPESWLPLSIAEKELLPVVVAAMVWGSSWKGLHIRCLSDNEAVVFALNRRSVRSPGLMRLIRCLSFVEVFFNFRLSASHLPGRLNLAADYLSRDMMGEFFGSFPQASPSAIPIPAEVSNLLLDLSVDWPSPTWSQQLESIMLRL